MDNELISTADAAKKLEMRQEYLRVILQRHPHLQPKLKIANVWLWTEAEIQAVANRNRKMGKPTKAEVVDSNK